MVYALANIFHGLCRAICARQWAGMVCKSLPVRAPAKHRIRGTEVKRTLINFVAFQAGWFSCVLSAAYGSPWMGLIVICVIVLSHVGTSEDPVHETQLVALAMTLGLIFDSILVSSGLVRYPGGMIFAGIAPYWILAMWALFSTTLSLSMGWLKNKPLLASFMGAVFGPLSYLAGQRMGAIELLNFNSAMIALAVIWALAMPILTRAASRSDGVSKFLPFVPLQQLHGGDKR